MRNRATDQESVVTHRAIPDRAAVAAVVDRIVACARPSRIILFGSASRGEMGPDSDLDLVVVVPDSADRRRTARSIYQALVGVGCAVDLLVVRPEDIADPSAQTDPVLRSALDDGVVLYAA